MTGEASTELLVAHYEGIQQDIIDWAAIGRDTTDLIARRNDVAAELRRLGVPRQGTAREARW